MTDEPKPVHLVFCGCDFVDIYQGHTMTNKAAEVTCRRCQQLMEQIPQRVLDAWPDMYPILTIEL